MKLCERLLCLAVFLCGLPAARADILILKDGKKWEGTILEERPDSVRMKYWITKSTPDTKDFPRADIQQIIKQSPQEMEIVGLRKLLPTPDLMPADKYEQIIQDQLRTFVNKYPGTPEAEEVNKMIQTLQEEKQKVSEGQAKVEGKWISTSEAKLDAYNIKAYQIRQEIKQKAAENNYVEALRAFDRFADAENGYPASTHYPKLIPDALAIMDSYEKQLNRMVAEQPILKKQREDGIKRLIEPDLSRTKKVIEDEVQKWKSTAEAEKKMKLGWMTVYKYDEKSLKDALKHLVTERGQLQVISLARLEAQCAAFTKVLRFLADKNLPEAEAALKDAQTAAGRESSGIFNKLRSSVTALKSEISKTKTTDRAAFGSKSGAISGDSAPATDDAVAAALAQADTKGMDKKGAGEDGKSAEQSGKGAGDTKAAGSKPKPSSSSAASSPASAVEEPGIQKYLLIAAGILIAVLIVAFMMQKKKA